MSTSSARVLPKLHKRGVAPGSPISQKSEKFLRVGGSAQHINKFWVQFRHTSHADFLPPNVHRNITRSTSIYSKHMTYNKMQQSIWKHIFLQRTALNTRAERSTTCDNKYAIFNSHSLTHSSYICISYTYIYIIKIE